MLGHPAHGGFSVNTPLEYLLTGLTALLLLIYLVIALLKPEWF